MTETLAETYGQLGYPAVLVIPLAIAKLLAVVAILTKKVKVLKTLAYYGLAIDFVIAAISHVITGVGSPIPPLVAFAILVVSLVYDRKLYPN